MLKRTCEVCFTPALYKYIVTDQNFVVVVIDVLRATTSITTAFDYGVKEIIPVSTDEEAISYKKNYGYLIAAESDGVTLEYADMGNSPFYFMNENLKGKTLVYKTTNGTQTIKMLKNSEKVVIASFLNLSTVCDFLNKTNLNVVILCSGWKNKFNLEDSLLAGAIVEKLKNFDFVFNCDSALAALDLWQIAKNDPVKYIQKAMHRERLRKLGLDDVIEYCFTADISNSLPVYNGLLLHNFKID